jgi:hypothetical protein
VQTIVSKNWLSWLVFARIKCSHASFANKRISIEKYRFYMPMKKFLCKIK